MTANVPAPSLGNNLLGDPVDQHVRIYLPPGYAPDSTVRYPVVYLLPGFSLAPDDVLINQWATVMHDSMVRFLRRHPSKKMIVVIVNGANAVYGSYYTDSSVSGNWERYVSVDLVKYVDAHYETLQSPNSRALVGHSMGGYGALKIGMQHPDVFGVVYAMSPCCLDFVADLTASNPAWLRVLRLNSLSALPALAKAGHFYEVALTALAIALSPDAHARLKADFPYRESGTRLVRMPSVIREWEAQMPVHMVDHYLQNLRRLRGIGVEYGLEDPFTHIPVGADEFIAELETDKIPFLFETYHGNHNNEIPSRIPTHMLPFVASKLQFCHQCAGPAADLH